jgi:hypothetical protein
VCVDLKQSFPVPVFALVSVDSKWLRLTEN